MKRITDPGKPGTAAPLVLPGRRIVFIEIEGTKPMTKPDRIWVVYG
jgi:hypothetical protein